MYIKLIGAQNISSRLMIETKWELWWDKEHPAPFGILTINEETRNGSYNYYFELLTDSGDVSVKDCTLFGSETDYWSTRVERSPIQMVLSTLAWMTNETSWRSDLRKEISDDWITGNYREMIEMAAMDADTYGIERDGEFGFSINGPQEES